MSFETKDNVTVAPSDDAAQSDNNKTDPYKEIAAASLMEPHQ